MAGSKRHRHIFTRLYHNFGWYGDQTAHVHPCRDEDCERALIGDGRDCDGRVESHHRQTLPLLDNDPRVSVR